MRQTAQPRPFDALVADDDQGVRDLLTDFLGSRGLSVAGAVDGRAAVTALERSDGACRLVFADISMPGADGFAVFTAARAANPGAYVVMITGYGALDTAITAVRLGAHDYLTKPFSLGQVDVVLKHAMARFALEDRRRADHEMYVALAAVNDRLGGVERHLRELSARLASRAGFR